MARAAGQEDWYAILGIDPLATPAEVKAAHRQLAKRWHPDTNPSPGAHDRMIELNRAREVLLDPAGRAAFDRLYWRRVQREAARARAAIAAAEAPARTVRVKTKPLANRSGSAAGQEAKAKVPGAAPRPRRDITGIYDAEPDFSRDWYRFLGLAETATDRQVREALASRAMAMQVPGISAAEVTRRNAELRTAQATIGTAAARVAYQRARSRQ